MWSERWCVKFARVRTRGRGGEEENKPKVGREGKMTEKRRGVGEKEENESNVGKEGEKMGI